LLFTVRVCVPIGAQKYHDCLCPLDLSAVFDIVDHNILITRLSSWFGIHGSVLSWFKSYLSSRSFRVKCDDNLSFLHTSYCGVLQGSVFGPLLFIMYTTPLSTLFSSIFLDHHLCADDTQHFFSFLLLNFESSIFHFENALQQISSWMTANLLLLTPPRLNFCSSDSKTNLPTHATPYT